MGGKTSTTTSTNTPPASVLANYGTLTSEANALAAQPITAPLQQTAQFNPTQGLATGNIAQQYGNLGGISDQLNGTSENAGSIGTNYTGLASQALGATQPIAGQIGQTAGTLGSLSSAAGQAATGIGSLANVYQPYYNQAENSTATGANMLSPQNYGQNVAQFLNPYTQNVVNATQGQFNNQNAIQGSQLLGSAIQSGNAFGGDRAGVAQAALAGQQQSAEAPVIAGLESAGYTNAQGELNTAANTALQAGQQYGNLGTGAEAAALAAPQAMITGLGAAGNLASSQAGALSGQAGALNQGYATAGNLNAGALSALGTQNQGAALQQANNQLGVTDSNALLAAGTLAQQTAQATDTAAYQQAENQIALPYQSLGFAANIGEGLGSNSGGTTTTTQPAPFFSDERLKEDKTIIGKTRDGQNLYRFRYKGDPSWRIGLIAQEVAKKHPEAVSSHGGLLAVDYKAATDKSAGKRGHFAAGGLPMPGTDVTSLIPDPDPLTASNGMGAGMPQRSGGTQQPSAAAQATQAMQEANTAIGFGKNVAPAVSGLGSALGFGAPAAAGAPMALAGAVGTVDAAGAAAGSSAPWLLDLATLAAARGGRIAAPRRAGNFGMLKRSAGGRAGYDDGGSVYGDLSQNDLASLPLAVGNAGMSATPVGYDPRLSDEAASWPGGASPNAPPPSPMGTLAAAMQNPAPANSNVGTIGQIADAFPTAAVTAPNPMAVAFQGVDRLGPDAGAPMGDAVPSLTASRATDYANQMPQPTQGSLGGVAASSPAPSAPEAAPSSPVPSAPAIPMRPQTGSLGASAPAAVAPSGSLAGAAPPSSGPYLSGRLPATGTMGSAPASSSPIAAVPMTPSERDLAIRTVYGEARGEPPVGQAAVASVIRNRTLSGGSNVGSVITSPYQFSVWNKGDPNGDIARKLQPADPAYRKIGAIVDGVMAGKTPDPTNGASSYYNPAEASPAWGPKLAQENDVTIGNHRFVGSIDGEGAGSSGTGYAPASTLAGGAAPRAIAAASTPSGTLGGAPPSASNDNGADKGLFGTGIKIAPEMGQALLAGLFGMLGSNSHWLLPAIGQGGLAGMGQYNTAVTNERQNALVNSEVAKNTMGMLQGRFTPMRDAAGNLSYLDGVTGNVLNQQQHLALFQQAVIAAGNPALAGLTNGAAGSAAAPAPAVASGGSGAATIPPAAGPMAAAGAPPPVSVAAAPPISPPAAAGAANPPAPSTIDPDVLKARAAANADPEIARLTQRADALNAQADHLDAVAQQNTGFNKDVAEQARGQANAVRLQAQNMSTQAQTQRAQLMETAIAASKARAEAEAKSQYDLVEMQPTPGGPTEWVPKSRVLAMTKSNPNAAPVGIGPGSPPGAAVDAAVAANPAIAKQPGFYAEKQKAIADDEDKMIEQMKTRNIAKQQLQAIQGVMQTYQPGAWAEQKADLAGKLRAVGIDVPASATANPAAFEEFTKYATGNVFNDVKGMGSKVLVSEIETAKKANANPGMQPEANAAIIGRGLGVINYENQHTNDYFDWKHQKDANGNMPNMNTVDTSTFELPWLNSHPLQPFVDQANKGIAYKGQVIPPNPADRIAGQAYMTPKGPFTWTKNGWQAQQ
jgi:spore germination cell wall hydrolase CwlJ-like protein